MRIKDIVKSSLGWIRCKINGIPYARGVYIGKNVHVENSRNILLGPKVSIRPDCDLFAGSKFVVGSNCDIGTRNRIAGDIIIGDYVLFGPDNYICSTDHCYTDIEVPIMTQGAFCPTRNNHKEIKIGEGSWIGTHVAIIGDVHIGKHCIIGANTVVTKDVPDYSVVVGNPGKVIKQYNFKTKCWEALK